MRWILVLLLIAGCGRPLTPQEDAFARHLMPGLDTGRVRILGDVPMAGATVTLPPRPRTTCVERIVPPRDETVTLRVAPAAFVLFDTMYTHRDWTLRDFVPGWPREVALYEALLFAHEMVHVWQWQNRAVTGYHPWKAVREHATLDDPYLIDGDPALPFLAHGYEQQARLVEEYLCCATLDPDGTRTERLRTLIAPAFPIGRLESVTAHVGWDGVTQTGLCG
ncbi:MAG: hypothetical protein ACU0CO_08415 [Shimia sp.]